jgi:hypothetical protein
MIRQDKRSKYNIKNTDSKSKIGRRRFGELRGCDLDRKSLVAGERIQDIGVRI